MDTNFDEAEILDLFRQLGIASDEDRQRLLLTLGYNNATQKPENVRFDIGFNAVLPSK